MTIINFDPSGFEAMASTGIKKNYKPSKVHSRLVYESIYIREGVIKGRWTDSMAHQDKSKDLD